MASKRSTALLVVLLGLAARGAARDPPSIEAKDDDLRITGSEVMFVQDPDDEESTIGFFETVTELKADINSLGDAAARIPLMESTAADQAVQIKALEEKLATTQEEAKDTKSTLESAILKLEKTVNDMASKLNDVTKCAESGDIHSNGDCVSPIPTCDLKDLSVSNGEMVLSSDDHEAIAGAKAIAKCKPTFGGFNAPAICKTDGAWNDASDRTCKSCPAGCATCTSGACDSCTDKSKQVKVDKTGCVGGVTTCRQLGVTKSGWYNLQPKENGRTVGKEMRAYCHVIGKEIHTSIPCLTLTGGKACMESFQLKGDNTCKQWGYDLYPARNPNHLKDALSIFGGTFFTVAPVARDTTFGALDACDCVMASKDFLGKGLSPCKGWRAADGKAFFVAGYSTTHTRKDGVKVCNPSGDYTPGCYLKYSASLGRAATYNDHNCNAKSSQYLCSTSDF